MPPDETIDVDHTTTAVALATNISPMQQVEAATQQANALMQVVKNGKLAKQIGQKQYLTVEAWQTIARFNGFLFDIEWTRELKDEMGAHVGYLARAVLVRIADGTRLSGAEGSCRHDETETRRDGTPYKRWSDDYAVRSMAQTRAMGKLGRANFSWVATLAGFEPTPAEEMHHNADSGPQEARQGTNGPPDEPEFPFGHNKGKKPSELDVATLRKEIPFWTKKAGEAGQYQASNQRVLAAIEAAIQAKEGRKASDAKPAPEGRSRTANEEALERVRLAKDAAKLCGALTAQAWAALQTEFGWTGKDWGPNPAKRLDQLAERLTNLSRDHQPGPLKGEPENDDLEPFGGNIAF